MEYKYGVEYPTNGERPNLPDDVLVQYKYKHPGDKWLKNPFVVGGLVWGGADVNHVTAFKIVDERYKPNSWHTRGELPPVGTECEYAVGTGSLGFKWCFFIGRTHSGSLLLEHTDGQLKSFHRGQIAFRPLRTEREKFIDAARVIRDQANTAEEYLGALFDAGFKAPEATK